MKKTLAIVAVVAMILSLLSVAIFAVKADAIAEVSEEGSDETSETASEEMSETASEESSEESVEEYSEEPRPDPPAETDLWIVIDRALGAAGREVKVNFTVQQNPGIWGISFYVDYDPAVLTLQSVKFSDKFKKEISFQPVKLTENPFTFRCFGLSLTENSAMTGVIGTAIFTVAEDAPLGTRTPIGVRFRAGDIINVASENVPFTVWDGYVRVIPEDQLPPEPSEEPSVEPSEESSEESSDESSETSNVAVPGDATGDGSVDMKDVLTIRKFIAGMNATLDEAAADVDGDGELTMKDVLKIRKYIAGLIENLP